MQTYLQKYFDYDTQRLQKGQLATIKLGAPPMLCRHFLPPEVIPSEPHGESGKVTPTQTPGGLGNNQQGNDSNQHLLRIDRPHCTKRSSQSSLQDDERRTPLLDKVTIELDEVEQMLDNAITRSGEIMVQQDTAKDRINEIVGMADVVESLIGGEVFQQVSSPNSAARWQPRLKHLDTLIASNAGRPSHAPSVPCY